MQRPNSLLHADTTLFSALSWIPNCSKYSSWEALSPNKILSCSNWADRIRQFCSPMYFLTSSVYLFPFAADSLSVFKMYKGGMAVSSCKERKIGSSSFSHSIDAGLLSWLSCSMHRFTISSVARSCGALELRLLEASFSFCFSSWDKSASWSSIRIVSISTPLVTTKNIA